MITDRIGLNLIKDQMSSRVRVSNVTVRSTERKEKFFPVLLIRAYPLCVAFYEFFYSDYKSWNPLHSVAMVHKEKQSNRTANICRLKALKLLKK